MSLFYKISLSFFATIFFIMSLSFYFFYHESSNILKNYLDSTLSANVKASGMHVKALLEENRNLIKIVSSNPVLKKVLLENKDTPVHEELLNTATARLKTIVELHEEIVSVFLLNSKNEIIASNMLPDHLSLKFSNLTKNAPPSFSELYFNKETKNFYFNVSYPIEFEKKNIGSLIAIFKADQLFKLISPIPIIFKSREILIINKDQDLISPVTLESNGKYLKPVIPSNGFCHKDPEGSSVSNPTLRPIHEFKDYRGINVLAAFQYIPELDCCLVLKIDRIEAFLPIDKLKLNALFGVSASILATMLIGFLLARNITKPIIKLEEGMKKVSAGDLSYKIANSSKDELGNFSRNFDKMTEKLKSSTTSITNLRKEIEDRKKAEKQIYELMQRKTEFTSMVSHELRTPLTSINESISLVLDESAGKLNAEQKDFLTIAKTNAERLNRIVTDILSLQKMEVGKMVFKIEENDINMVIKQTLKSLQPLVKSDDLKIKTQLDEALPKIPFDYDRISEVMMNLLDNAIKFTLKGTITISSEKTEEGIQVSVTDTGIGIKEDQMYKLFERFVQIGKAQVKVSTGLGLAICKNIIEQHKGKIWAKSEFGKGSVFSFILPYKQ